MKKPLVTCLCLTMAGREEYLKRAIDCFQRQTYSEKHLLIIGDEWDAKKGPFGEGRTKDVTGVFVGLPKMNVGEKRNAGCSLVSTSNLIATWDDDDYSSPGRLAQQVEELEVTRKAVTGYRVMKFTDGSGWWRYSLPRGQCFGSSLLFTREWWSAHPFKQIQIGEDAAFCEEAAAANELSEVPDLSLMYATIHPGNTSERKVNEGAWVSLPGFEWKEKS